MAEETVKNLKLVTAYLGLGSNIGERRSNLGTALSLLAASGLSVVKVSSVYDTEPVGNINQPRFLNLACEVRTRLAPIELLKLAKEIEKGMGRVTGEPNSPRPIDIDILVYDELVMETPTLSIPHPRLTERAFVLVPLAEIAPDLMHPVTGKTVRQLLKELDSYQTVEVQDV